MNGALVRVVTVAFSTGAMWSADTKAKAILCADFYAARYGVPRELVHAIIEVESGWQPYAVSAKGAAGLMQLMPGTAARLGIRNRFRMEQNIEGGVAYLSWLEQQFHGDLRLVTAAYFAGENRISRESLNYSSPEVYRYVSRVAGVYRRNRIGALRGDRKEGGTYDEWLSQTDLLDCAGPVHGAKRAGRTTARTAASCRQSGQ